MTIQVELNADVEARLVAAAQARGIALEKYAETLLSEMSGASPSGTGKLTVDELHTMLRELAADSDKLPNLPTSSFSRESFYEDRS